MWRYILMRLMQAVLALLVLVAVAAYRAALVKANTNITDT